MAKVRAYGADATLKACRETSCGVAFVSGYRSLDFKSTDLSSEQPLGDDPLLRPRPQHARPLSWPHHR